MANKKHYINQTSRRGSTKDSLLSYCLKASALALLLFISTLSHAQSVVRLSAGIYLGTMGVDTVAITDTTLLLHKLNNVKGGYVAKADSAQYMANRMQVALTGMNNSGEYRDSVLWIDETSCYYNYLNYKHQLETSIATAKHFASVNQQLERERIERERREAEEKARREAKQRQDALDKQLQEVKDAVIDQHTQIESICIANGVTDKAKVKALKDIRYSYLPIYNKYDVSPTQGSITNIGTLTELKDFQRHLLDSILGPASYPTQIENFIGTLRTRCGKNHSDLLKSYQRVFKKVALPSSFSNLTDYWNFVRQMREIAQVQQEYITAIELRETISNKTTNIQNHCGKQHKDVFESYNTVLHSLDQVPTFSTLGESDMFLGSLREFVQVQDQYIVSINRLTAIELRGDSIINICGKKLADVADAYKELSANTSFIPTYRSLAGATFFHNSLRDFEQLQEDYITIIGLRNIVKIKADSIFNCKMSPKGLTSAYKDIQSRTVFTPCFTTHNQALNHIELFNYHIEQQNNFLLIQEKYAQIENNTLTIKNQSKNAPNINKAYNILLKTYDLSVKIYGANDIEKYLKLQNKVLEMQKPFVNAVMGSSKEIYNNALKGEKDPAHIRATMGL